MNSRVIESRGKAGGKVINPKKGKLKRKEKGMAIGEPIDKSGGWAKVKVIGKRMG